MSEKAKGKVVVYASGGGGLNIVASRFEKHRNKPAPGFAAIEPVYIDTSKSNLLRNEVPEDAIYHFQGLDGAGQVRREHATTVKDKIKEILLTHKPGDLNIPLHTASGGSGSVIGPLLVAELLARGLPVLPIVIGDASTRLFAENTLNTIKSYEGIAKTAGVPLVIAYIENSRDLSRAEVDQLADDVVTGLAALFSRENSELDSRDLYNWLRFDKVTTFKQPMLASLTILKNGESFGDRGNVISIATLAKEGADTTIPIMPEVRFLGLLPPDINQDVAKASPVHFVTSDALIPNAAAKLRTVLEQLTEAQEARSAGKQIIGAGERADETGLFL
jgi:hypothetical protein